MKSIARLATIAAAALALTGCASYMKTVTKIQNMGFELHESSVNAHLYAEVNRDEEYLGNLRLPLRAQYMPGGVEPDNGTYNYRIVETYMTLTDPKNLMVVHGSKFAFRPAVVPDQFPRLMKGDIVELRNTGTYDVLANLATTGEGAAIVRVFCKAGSPNYAQCRASMPTLGYSPRPAGVTGSKFYPSLKDYAPLTFSKWYDDKGNALHAFPKVMPEGYGISAVAAGGKETAKNEAPVEDRVVPK